MRTTDRGAFVALALGGVLFNVYGPMHPGDSGHGNKVEQLHEMVVDAAWYPAHLVGLLAVGGFAAGAWALRRRGPAGVRRLNRMVWLVAAVAVPAMAVHALTATAADSIVGGEANLVYYVAVVNEAFVSAAWALAFAALAVVGGLTRTVGNAVTAALGLVGGGVLGAVYATIPFTDTLDPLFPIGGLLGLWAVVIGVWYAVKGDAVVPVPSGARS
jgi:hypothetical protein